MARRWVRFAALGGTAAAAAMVIVSWPKRPPAGWVRIGPGTFDMGSPAGEPGREDDEAPRKVTIARAYWLKSTEVTQGEWEAAMGSNPSRFKACGQSCPVESVTWYQAIAYCNALSRKEGLAPCYLDGGKAYDEESAAAERAPGWPEGLACVGYRLPTAAEWEHAARAGTTTAFYTGPITKTKCELDANLDPAGWYCGNAAVQYAGCEERSTSGTASCVGTHPVKQKAPNAWGLYDMLGNVWELAWDGEASGPVGRGGSWGAFAGRCRAAALSRFSSGYRHGNLGLRPARSIP